MTSTEPDRRPHRCADRGSAGVQVRSEADLEPRERELLALAGLDGLAPVEAWTVLGTSRQLAVATHGVFRFFGKFPPPIARHLMTCFTAPGDWVLDPMTGSGTTAVEAVGMGRHVVVRDVSPLSMLLCRTKTTRVSLADSRRALTHVEERFGGSAPGSAVGSDGGRKGAEAASPAAPLIVGSDAGTGAAPPAAPDLPGPVGLRNAAHWFLPETTRCLGRLRAAIEPEPPGPVRDLLLTAFASTVRRVSRATTQQGRLFLDAETARADAWPTFVARFDRYAKAVDALPPRGETQLHIELHDAKTPPPSDRRFRLAITHPPYFNNYRYSAINSLELAWLGVAPKDVRGREIREAFKVGKPEKVTDYVADLAATVEAIAAQLEPGGVLALMMGDTFIRGSYIDVTRRLLRAIEARAPLRLERVVLRVPQYTEASWVASQRRTGDRIGVTLCDFVLLFARTGGAA